MGSSIGTSEAQANQIVSNGRATERTFTVAANASNAYLARVLNGNDQLALSPPNAAQIRDMHRIFFLSFSTETFFEAM